MKNDRDSYRYDKFISEQTIYGYNNTVYPRVTPKKSKLQATQDHNLNLAEILVISSYPPRECGIATYSQDLIKALNNKFSNSLSIKVCSLESGDMNFQYSSDVRYVLKTSLYDRYGKLALKINNDDQIRIVLIQHEFGFFKKQEEAFIQFLTGIIKPVVIVFHTVLPYPDKELKSKIKNIEEACESIITMTHNSA